MKLTSFLCCEIALQDVRTNILSMINVCDVINARAFPIAIPKITAVVLLERDAGEPESQTTRLSAELNGRQFLDAEMAANFQGSPRTRMIAEIQGMPVDSPGDLIFDFCDFCWRSTGRVRSVGDYNSSCRGASARFVLLFSDSANTAHRKLVAIFQKDRVVLPTTRSVSYDCPRFGQI